MGRDQIAERVIKEKGSSMSFPHCCSSFDPSVIFLYFFVFYAWYVLGDVFLQGGFFFYFKVQGGVSFYIFHDVHRKFFLTFLFLEGVFFLKMVSLIFRMCNRGLFLTVRGCFLFLEVFFQRVFFILIFRMCMKDSFLLIGVVFFFRRFFSEVFLFSFLEGVFYIYY